MQNVSFQSLLKYTINDAYNNLVMLERTQKELKEQPRFLEILGLARQRLLKLLALLRTPISSQITEAFQLLDKQDLEIETCANELFNLHLEYKRGALPNLDLQSAIDILTTGKYRQLPLIISNLKLHIDESEQQEILKNMTGAIEVQLFCNEKMTPKLRSRISVSDGTIIIDVSRLFRATLSLLLDTRKWRLLNLDIHSEIGGESTVGNQGLATISDFQKGGLMKHLQDVLDKQEDNRLMDFYLYSEQFCLKYKLRIFSEQLKVLSKTTWHGLIEAASYSDYINVKYWDCKHTGRSGYRYNLQIMLNQKNNSEIFNGLELWITDLLNQNEKAQVSSEMFQAAKSMDQLMNTITKQSASDILNHWQSILLESGIESQKNDGQVVHSLEIQVLNRILLLELNSRTGVAVARFQDFIDSDAVTVQKALQELSVALNQGKEFKALQLIEAVEYSVFNPNIDETSSDRGDCITIWLK